MMSDSVNVLSDDGRRVDVLPDWLMNKLPEVRKCGLLGYDYYEDIFWVKDKNDALSYYSSLSEAVNGDCNLSIDDSVLDSHKVVNNCIVNKNNSGMVFVKNDSGRFNKLVSKWAEWRLLADKVVEDKASWQDSYRFVETFPFFWKPLSNLPTFDWATENGHDHVKQILDGDEILLYVGIDEDDENIDDYDKRSILVVSDSIDEAYVQLAKKLVEFVNIDDCSC